MSESNIDTFSNAMKGKWARGVEEHGTTLVVDVFKEAKEECLDLALYSMIIYFRLQDLERRCHGLLDAPNPADGIFHSHLAAYKLDSYIGIKGK